MQPVYAVQRARARNSAASEDRGRLAVDFTLSPEMETQRRDRREGY